MGLRRAAARVLSATVTLGVLSACAACTTAGSGLQGLPSRDDGITDVVVTTPVLADLARNVAGDSARVTALIPPSADPHTHEMTLRDVRNLANADLALTNGLYLEEQSVLRTVDSGVLPETPVVSVAEEAQKNGATVIPLVENLSLDTVWLGLRAIGKGKQLGGTATSQVRMGVTHVDGPGEAAAYVTGTFGQPEIFFNTADGIDQFDDPSSRDATVLPPDAHTHMSWAFSTPGVYHVTFSSQLDNSGDGNGKQGKPTPLATKTVTFAVGVSGEDHSASGTKKHIGTGHQDIAINLDDPHLSIVGDDGDINIDDAIIDVPPKALQQIPAGASFRFLGTPGSETYLLPQAVLGKHVHGELDPHVWHSIDNAQAMIEVIKQQLTRVDPTHAADYSRNAQVYREKLSELDGDVRGKLQSIPESQRHLVTAHDGYAYLAKAYDLDVAGFVTPNPSVEPSTRDIIALTRTLENLKVPAVFIEPSMVGRAKDLQEIARRAHVEVCSIYGDTFDDHVTTYEDMMRTNADNIARCLGGAAQERKQQERKDSEI